MSIGVRKSTFDPKQCMSLAFCDLRSYWAVATPLWLEYILFYLVIGAMAYWYFFKRPLYQEVGALGFMIRSDIGPWPVKSVAILSKLLIFQSLEWFLNDRRGISFF